MSTPPSSPSSDSPASPATGLRPYGFQGPADYIERITYGIWNGAARDPGLISRYYAPDAPIHLDGGDLRGAEAVIANTVARLRAFPDFHGTIDDTIWCGDEDQGYRTSMRWTWTGTNDGPSAFGPATGHRVRFSAIANCVVRGQEIVQEWLGANPLALARSLGYADSDGLTGTPPAADGPSASGTRPSWTPVVEGPGSVVADAWRAAFRSGGDDSALAVYAPGAPVALGPDRTLTGADGVAEWLGRWRAAVPELTWTLDDQYAQGAQEPGGPDRVATQWTASGEGVRICGISHHHVQDGTIVREWTHYDELALLGQGVPELP